MMAANAAILWDNRSDKGVISATSFAPLMPPDVLQNHHVKRKWRALDNSVSLYVDLQAIRSIDTFGLFGINLTSGGFSRIRASASDPNVTVDVVYDSSPMSGKADPKYQSLIQLISAPVNCRYVRWDLSDVGLTYIEAGRLVVGKRYRFVSNFAYGWSRGYVDESRMKRSRGGQTYIDAGPTYRQLEVEFEQITPSERVDVWEEIDRVNGLKQDVLFLMNPESTNLNRDSIWGLMLDLPSISQPTAAEDALGPVYSRRFAIGERL